MRLKEAWNNPQCDAVLCCPILSDGYSPKTHHMGALLLDCKSELASIAEVRYFVPVVLQTNYTRCRCHARSTETLSTAQVHHTSLVCFSSSFGHCFARRC